MVEKLRKAILNREKVLLAVIHGGFLELRPFRDIDVAVYTGYSIPYEEELDFCEQLSLELTDIAGIYVDVRMLDYSPPRFRVSALSNCVVLVERYPRAFLLRASIQELDDIEKKASLVRGWIHGRG
ncbi:MAG: nucleotidyltransferase domain-containing protein [Candidatus Korarchaeota archaeon]|nr:nucleotidyltransferase domain-containing protein [Candidatus Korarchaeota archaeon]